MYKICILMRSLSALQASERERQDYSDDVEKMLEQASEEHMETSGNIMKYHETSHLQIWNSHQLTLHWLKTYVI